MNEPEYESIFKKMVKEYLKDNLKLSVIVAPNYGNIRVTVKLLLEHEVFVTASDTAMSGL